MAEESLALAEGRGERFLLSNFIVVNVKNYNSERSTVLRLDKRAFFNCILSKCKKTMWGLSVYCVANNLYLVRVGISIPKKHYPSAVHRNRVRRVFKNVFTKLVNAVGFDFVIVVKSPLYAINLSACDTQQSIFNESCATAVKLCKVF